jgi:hypothetical protein
MADGKEVEKVLDEDRVVESMADILASATIEYATIPGYKPGQKLRIGSLTAGDMIEWSEANDGDAKRTAGLRLITKSLVGNPPENRRIADDPKNIAAFRMMPHKETERIVQAIIKLNGLKVGQDDAAKKD